MNNASQKTKEDFFNRPGVVKSISVIACAFISAQPMISIWSGNVSQLNLLEGLWLAALAGLVGAFIGFTITSVLKKNIFLSAIISVIACFTVFNFGFFRDIGGKLFGTLSPLLSSLIITAVFLGAVLFLVIRFRQSDLLHLFICVISVILIVFNLITLAGGLINGSLGQKRMNDNINQLKKMKGTKEAIMLSETPNIYFLLADEMANETLLEKYYGVSAKDNTFFAQLTAQGFNVSNNSYSYLDHTTGCECNLFSLDYIYHEDMPDDEAMAHMVAGDLILDLESVGYDCFQVSTHPGDFFMLDDRSGVNMADKLVNNISYDGDTVMDMFFSRTIFSLITMASDDVTFLDSLVNVFLNHKMQRVKDFYLNPESFTSDRPQAVFSYLLAPHTPFFLDKNGNPVKSTHRCEWESPEYYRDMWFYTADYLQEIIDSILANDPNCIIILQSDHGVRGGQEASSKRYDILPEDKCMITNAVFYCGKEMNIEGLSAINTWRLVLSELGLDLPPVQDGDFIFFQPEV